VSTNSLLPNKFKNLGWFLIIPGFLLSILRFYYGIKLTILDIHVFAIYSSYFDTKYFSIIENHVSEEIAGILILFGLLILVFHKEKEETDHIIKIRYESLLTSLIINSTFMLVSLLFVFGIGFVEMMIANIFSQLIIYLVIFRLKVLRHIRKFKE